MIRTLIDTDVCLDFILQRRPFFVEASELFTRIGNGDFPAYISAVTPINVAYFTRKEKGISGALQAVRDLQILTIVIEINGATLQNALTSPISDYEDAVQHECAVREGLDALVTRNAKDYKNASVKVDSPAEFLNFLRTV